MREGEEGRERKSEGVSVCVVCLVYDSVLCVLRVYIFACVWTHVYVLANLSLTPINFSTFLKVFSTYVITVPGSGASMYELEGDTVQPLTCFFPPLVNMGLVSQSSYVAQT